MQSFKARGKGRRYAMQALYSWVISSSDVYEIEAFYLKDRNPNNFDVAYFHRILHDVVNKQTEIDAVITRFIDRPFKDVSTIELTILRVATYEMIYSFDVPFKVIISEAVELAKTFGADDSHKFINSILDNMATELRAAEKSAKESLACKKNTIQESVPS